MMYRPNKIQSKKSTNWISIDYDVMDYEKGTGMTNILSLEPIEHDYNSLEDWRWEGKDWDANKIFVLCKKGSDSNIIFSDNFPHTFTDAVEIEVKRILRKYQ